MARNSQVARIYAIFDILAGAPQGLTVKEVWKRVQDRGHVCGDRTVYRDLEALQQAGFPLTSDNDAGEDHGSSRWTVDRTTKINQYLVFTAPELMALYLAREMLVPFKDTPLYTGLNEAFDKIAAKVGLKGQQYIDDLSQEIRFDSWPRWGLGIDPQTIETARACCFEGHALEVHYSSANSGTERVRRLGPHYLYFAKGGIYLVAEDLEDKQVKLFAIPRMTNARMLDEAYEGNPINPDELMQSSFGLYRGVDAVPVVLEFEKELGPFVSERSWSKSQRIEPLAHGRVRLSLEVAITPDLVQWVLGFGPAVTIVGPATLREQVTEAARAVLQKYRISKAA